MTRVRFTKMHGAGNDFVVVDCLEGSPPVDPAELARLTLDRRRGVGGDQLLLVQPSREADFAMGIRNADGSSAQMCVNGIRAFYKYLRDRGRAPGQALRVETLGGIVGLRWLGDDQVEVEVPRPILEPQKIPTALRGDPPLLEVPLEVGGGTLRVTPVSLGNPHCVVFVPDPEQVDVRRLGSALEHHPAFPERTNVEFAAVRSREEIVQRTWERGSGETLACGSGACATAVAAILTGRTAREVVIRLRGGDLRVRWPDAQGPVWLTGPAVEVFEGEIAIP